MIAPYNRVTTVLSSMLALALAQLGHSAAVTLTSNNASGASGFNSATGWSPAGAPSTGNTYSLANFLLRSPTGVQTLTFQGDSLTVGTSAGSLSRFLIKSATGSMLTVNSLILNGGLLDQATSAGSASTTTLAGNINVISASYLGATATTAALAETLNISAQISGSAALQINGNDGYITAAGSSITNEQGTVRLSAANTYSGVITVAGTPLNATQGALNLNHLNAVQNATVQLSSGGTNRAMTFNSSANTGTFKVGGLSGSSNLPLSDTAGGNVAVQVGGNNQGTTFSGVLSGGGALIKAGSGTLSLSNSNTYTGSTTVNVGTLALGSAGSIASSSEVILAGGASLTANTFTMLASQPFTFTIDATLGSAGLLNVGTLNITNGVVNFSTVGTLTAPSYVFASYNSNLTGSVFASVANVPSGYMVDYNYLGGNMIGLVAVPEPSSSSLMIIGMIGFIVLYRSRKKKSL